MKRIGVISDTHGYIDDRILHHLSSCDEVWHAGDIGSLEVTDQISKVSHLRAVYGNIDDANVRREFRETISFTCEGAHIIMTHIAGRPGKYPKDLNMYLYRERPNIFVCGHSHLLLVQMNKPLQMLHINPGAAGVKGFHKQRTLIRFSLNNGKPSDLEVIELGARGGLT